MLLKYPTGTSLQDERLPEVSAIQAEARSDREIISQRESNSNSSRHHPLLPSSFPVKFPSLFFLSFFRSIFSTVKIIRNSRILLNLASKSDRFQRSMKELFFIIDSISATIGSIIFFLRLLKTVTRAIANLID